MKIKLSQLRRLIKEEVQKSMGGSPSSVEDVYRELRSYCGAERHVMPVATVAKEIGMEVKDLIEMLESDEFYNYMESYDYSMPIFWDPENQQIQFSDPMSN